MRKVRAGWRVNEQSSDSRLILSRARHYTAWVCPRFIVYHCRFRIYVKRYIELPQTDNIRFQPSAVCEWYTAIFHIPRSLDGSKLSRPMPCINSQSHSPENSGAGGSADSKTTGRPPREIRTFNQLWFPHGETNKLPTLSETLTTHHLHSSAQICLDSTLRRSVMIRTFRSEQHPAREGHPGS